VYVVAFQRLLRALDASRLIHCKGFLEGSVTRMTADNKLDEEHRDDEVSLMDMFMHMFREYVLQPEVQRELFRPLLKWFLWNLMPYVLLFIGLNFFTTLAAVALVFFSVNRNKKMFS